jgi:hypothetical protein
MSLFDDLEHRLNLMGPPTSGTDAGGGVEITWPTARAMSVPCLVCTASSQERELFAQQGISVSHTIAFEGDGAGVQRGDKLTTVDLMIAYHIVGIRVQDGVGGIDQFTYVFAQEQINQRNPS